MLNFASATREKEFFDILVSYISRLMYFKNQKSNLMKNTQTINLITNFKNLQLWKQQTTK